MGSFATGLGEVFHGASSNRASAGSPSYTFPAQVMDICLNKSQTALYKSPKDIGKIIFRHVFDDKDKPEIISLDVVDPLSVKNVIQPPNISTELLINSDILLFANTCCKKTDKTNLRFGLKDIFKIYETWCKINGKKCLKTQKKFKEEFEKINYKEENSKGVDVNNKPGKRGYNIMISL